MTYAIIFLDNNEILTFDTLEKFNEKKELLIKKNTRDFLAVDSDGNMICRRYELDLIEA